MAMGSEPKEQKSKMQVGEFTAAQRRERMFDLTDWDVARAQMRELPVFVAGLPDPPLELIEKVVGGVPGFMGAGDARVVVEAANPPKQSDSLGFVGLFVKVGSTSSFIPGTLVLPLSKIGYAGVDEQTLRLFRWNEHARLFDPVAVSRVAARGGFLWGRITAPGYYAAIGLPAHPLALRTVAILDLLCGLSDVLPSMASRRLLEQVCGLLLGSPELHKLINGEGVLERLRQESWLLGLADPGVAWRPNPGFEAGDLIDRCPALPSFRLPESVLLPYTWTRGHVAPRPVCRDDGWQSVGPVNIPGCMLQVIVDPTNPDRLYAAASHGGVWTLPSVFLFGDVAWTPLTDANDTLVTSAIAVAASDVSVIYLVDGLGRLLRSDTRGASWNLTGSPNVGNVHHLLVDPRDANVVWVASTSGLKRSRDGGSTWDSTPGAASLYDGDVTDAVFDPDDPSILYFAVRGIGLLKTSNGGTDFQLLLSWTAASSPAGTMIKIAVGHLGSDANRTVAVRFDYEVIVNHNGGRPPTMPGGGPWVSKGMVGRNPDPRFLYGDWCHVIAIDPFDNDVILSGAQELFRTNDGGDAWTNVVAQYSDAHADQHSVAFDPAHQGVVYVANDGGVIRSIDSGATWNLLHWGLVTGQLFPLGIHGTHAVTGMGHHGIQTTGSLGSRIWAGPGGGGWEWTRVYADPNRADIYYMAHDDLVRYRWPSASGDGAFTDPFGTPVIHPMVGGNQVAAVAIDTREVSRTAIVGTPHGRVMRTLDVTVDGPAWAPVTGISLPGEGVAGVAFAPSAPGSAYAISENGTVFYTTDVNLDTPWTRTGRWTQTGIEQIAVNAVHDDRLYAVAPGEVARSEDRGASWISIGTRGEAGLPDSPFRSIVPHPNDGQTIFLGTEIGVFISTREGAGWLTYNIGLPHAIIGGLVIDSGYLYAATYGRGLWRRRVCL
jgi:photosystem II stability/assembly factor-like uncharacterized protein